VLCDKHKAKLQETRTRTRSKGIEKGHELGRLYVDHMEQIKVKQLQVIVVGSLGYTE